MNGVSTTDVVGLAAIIGAIAGAVTPLLLQAMKGAQERHKGELDEAGKIRLELRNQVQRLDDELHKRDVELAKRGRDIQNLREYIGAVVKESSIAMYLAIGNIEGGRHEQALTRLKRGVEKLETLKVPEEEE